MGYLIVFCAKNWRVALNLKAQALHRTSLAGSFDLFLGKVEKKEKEEKIIVTSSLMNAITSFGSTGFLSKGDENIMPFKSILSHLSKVDKVK